MRRAAVLFAMLAVTVAAVPAPAEFAWDFSTGLEGWQAGDTSPGGWGMHGAALSWAPNGNGDGMLVVTYAGGYGSEVTEAAFNPAVFRFYWISPAAWDNSAAGNGGSTGRYCVVRMRVNGTTPPTCEGEHWGRFETFVQRWCAGSATSDNYLWGSVPMGSWVTAVLDLGTTPPDPAERLTLRLGTVGHQSYAFFESGGTAEIDWIRFVDDATPYLVWTFDSDMGMWQENGDYLYGYNGFKNAYLQDGNLVCEYEDASSGGFVPMLTGECVLLASTPLYLHMRCRVNCDPSLSSFDALAAWEAGGAALSWATVPTNAWTRVSYEIPLSVAASQWRLDFGADYASWPELLPAVQLLGANVEIDYILFSDFPGGQDTDGDGLMDYEEVSIYGTAPDNGDSDGDGLTDTDEIETYGSNPLVADSDGDSLDDGDEIAIGTDPSDPDTDGDGDPDGAEVALRGDPLDPESHLPAASSFGLLLTVVATGAAAGRRMRA